VRAGTSAEANEDRRLLAAVAEGDRAALGTLYDRFASDMLALAQRMLGGAREAEDLVHDVFLEAWHRARHYDPARGSVRTWLMLRVRSRALDRLRSSKRQTWVVLDENAPQERTTSEDEVSARARDQRALHGVLRELPRDQRTVLELGYFAGYSCAEIASELSIPLGTVKSRMSRAILALRARYEETGGGVP
jgi:RNA polymerase sigma-70 factor, ECF subfamily